MQPHPITSFLFFTCPKSSIVYGILNCHNIQISFHLIFSTGTPYFKPHSKSQVSLTSQWFSLYIMLWHERKSLPWLEEPVDLVVFVRLDPPISLVVFETWRVVPDFCHLPVCLDLIPVSFPLRVSMSDLTRSTTLLPDFLSCSPAVVVFVRVVVLVTVWPDFLLTCVLVSLLPTALNATSNRTTS